MRLYYSPRYTADIGNHTMPIHKFGLVAKAIEQSGLPYTMQEPEPVDDEVLERVHTKQYIDAIRFGQPKDLAESQKFPWSPQLAESVRWTNGGCISALDAALADGISGNLASGFHHAHADHGEGFCTFNGLIVALEAAKASGKIRRGLVVDMDLHYGNGTASLLQSRPDFYAVSIYGNWYWGNRAYKDVDQEKAPDTENSWSVAVPNGSKADLYLELASKHVAKAIEHAKPDILLYQAGADPYREDPYSPLDLGLEDLFERDKLIFGLAKRAGIPVAWVLAGGYTKDITKIVQVHLGTFIASQQIFQ